MQCLVLHHESHPLIAMRTKWRHCWIKQSAIIQALCGPWNLKYTLLVDFYRVFCPTCIATHPVVTATLHFVSYIRTHGHRHFFEKENYFPNSCPNDINHELTHFKDIRTFLLCIQPTDSQWKRWLHVQHPYVLIDILIFICWNMITCRLCVDVHFGCFVFKWKRLSWSDNQYRINNQYRIKQYRCSVQFDSAINKMTGVNNSWLTPFMYTLMLFLLTLMGCEPVGCSRT